MTDKLQEHEERLNILEKTKNDILLKIEALQDKFMDSPRLKKEKYIFLHKELMKMDDKTMSKNELYLVFNKKYGLSYESFENIWGNLIQLDDNFCLVTAKNGKRAFSKKYESGRAKKAYITALEVVYPN